MSATKIQKLFDKLLDDSYQIQTDTYLNRLQTHLVETNDEYGGPAKIPPEFLSNWLRQVLAQNNRLLTRPQIFTFILNFVAQRCSNGVFYAQNEQILTELLEFLYNYVNESGKIVNPSIKLGYIKIITSLINHGGGMDFLEKNPKYWQNIIAIAHSDVSTLYINRECYRFIVKFLENTFDSCAQPTFVHRIIEEILRNFQANRSNLHARNETDVELARTYSDFKPSLQLLHQIVETTLKNRLFDIALIFIESYDLEAIAENLLLVSIAHVDFFQDLSKILLGIYFVRIYSEKCGETDAKYLDKILTLLRYNINKGYWQNMIKTLHLALVYCNNYHLVTVESLDKSNEGQLGDHILLLHLVPICCSPISNFVPENVDCIRDIFIAKVMKLMSENTLRLCYNWRDLLFSNQEYCFEAASLALACLMQSKNCMERNRAIIILQTFLYTLKDVLSDILTEKGPIEKFKSNATFYAQLFTAVREYTEQFQINWRDSVETICVLSLAIQYLELDFWPTNFQIEALKLTNTAIMKYMSPNMALLVDNTKNTTMGCIGGMLKSKIEGGEEWEVKDSALEVVCTVAHISKTKFPSLQKVLMDSQLPQLVVKMMENENEEAFVRSTAMKCLQEMIQVDEIWESVLRNADLVPKVMKLLESEPEAQIRIEATNFLNIAYCNSLLASNEAKEQVYATLNGVALNDLHWEVKLEALNFWSKVIQMQLDDYGMIDGKFPNVTFSKEQKKIVVLNEMEIRKRLEKIMEFLYRVGCLNVLNESIWDDVANGGDVEVCKKAVEITNNLMGLLKQFNVKMNATNDDLLSMVDENGKDCDRSKMTPRRFIETNESQEKLDEIISGKMQWLNGMDDLDSLLDDMLQTYDGNDVNLMDCY